MPRRSQELRDAIAYQLENRVERRGDDYLCRRCGNVVPSDMRFVSHLPGDPSTVWGPYCSADCTCYAKICSGCKKDFIVDDETQIKYFGDGKWFCTECAKDIITCTSCGTITSDSDLMDSPNGRICSRCFNNKYFKDTHTLKICRIEDKIRNMATALTKAQYPTLFEDGVELSKTSFNKLVATMEPLDVVECKACKSLSISASTKEGYCLSCRKSGAAAVCSDCGRLSHKQQLYKGKIICDSCRKKNYYKCGFCGEMERKGAGSIVNGFYSHKICDSCTKKKIQECPSCLKLGLSKQMKTYDTKGGKVTMCRVCQGSCNFCSSCKDFHYDEGQCRSSMDGLMNYSYTPHLKFNHGDNYTDKLFFGFENEINFSSGSDYNSSVRKIYEDYKSSQIYLKSDSSINGNGYELVSMPMTLPYFKAMKLGSMFDIEPKRSDDSCGLHCHVNRQSFISDVHIFKVVSFINNNEGFVTSVAGRQYCGYAKKLKGKASVYVKEKKRTKYSAVNLSPANTIEIRIFRGAKTEYELRYRIEFVHALVTWTRTASLKANADEFKSWVLKRKGIYPSLHGFIKAGK